MAHIAFEPLRTKGLEFRAVRLGGYGFRLARKKEDSLSKASAQAFEVQLTYALRYRSRMSEINSLYERNKCLHGVPCFAEGGSSNHSTP